MNGASFLPSLSPPTCHGGLLRCGFFERRVGRRFGAYAVVGAWATPAKPNTRW